MEQTLQQLGGLILGSIPTIVLLLVAFFAYRTIVHVPLERVLAERRSKTEGALERARADIAAAEAKTAEYESALREARLKVFRALEARRQKALEIRATAVAQARSEAEARVRQERALIDLEVAESKTRLEGESQRLAAAVIRTIFRQVGAAHSLPAGGGE